MRLLKLTTWRSDNKSTSQLPPYMMRTRDSDSLAPPSSSSNSIGNGAAGGSGSSSSRGKRLAAIDTLDDAVAAGQLQQDSESSSWQGGNMGSRWRSNSPTGGDESSGSASGSSRSISSRRMFSASDPIRRPRSRQGRDEWVLPWQVGMLGDKHTATNRPGAVVEPFENRTAQHNTAQHSIKVERRPTLNGSLASPAPLDSYNLCLQEARQQLQCSCFSDTGLCMCWRQERNSPVFLTLTVYVLICAALQEGGDSSKEEERKFRRAVFSFERWAAHRSTWRCVRHVACSRIAKRSSAGMERG